MSPRDEVTPEHLQEMVSRTLREWIAACQRCNCCPRDRARCRRLVTLLATLRDRVAEDGGQA